MELIPVISAGAALLTVTLALLTFILAQARWQRDYVEKGDKAVQEAESKARHDLANRVMGAIGELKIEQNRLSRETYRRDEAKDMESRFTAAVNEVKAEMKVFGDRLAQLPAMAQQLATLTHTLDRLVERLQGRTGSGD